MTHFAVPIVLASLLATSCNNTPSAAQEMPQAGDEYRGFRAPQRVTIRGYDGGAIGPGRPGWSPTQAPHRSGRAR
jgi:hypothetical protein